jgi:nucleotide-binding universal stress UspA family protein
MTKPKLLCPIDCSPCSAGALRAALSWAARLGAELHVLLAYQVPYYIQPSLLIWMGAGPRPLWELAEEQASTQLQEFLTQNSIDLSLADVRLVHGEPAVAILTFAERDGIDWIVMGTHGRSGARRWALGSVAERVVRRAPCPVIVIPIRDKAEKSKPIFEPRLL